MAELLIRTVDKPRSDDPAIDCQRSGRGDVIAACPDGWAWSHAERSNPDWMILRVPGMTESEGVALTSAEPPTLPLRRLRHKRLFRLDADAILGPHPGWRVVESATVALGDVRAARSRKAPVPDPYVIGRATHPDVIG